MSYTGSGVIVQIPFYGYSDAGNCTTSCLQEAIGGAYSDNSTYTGTVANYTNFACTQGGSAQSFGIGIQSAVATLTCPGGIGGDSVTLTYSSSQSTTYAYFYYPSAEKVYQVVSGTNTVPSSSYVTSSGSLAACTAPCVLLNATSHYVEAKLASPLNVAFYVESNGQTTTTTAAPPGAGGGGGGGAGNSNDCGPNTTMIFNQTLDSYECVGASATTSFQAPPTGNPVQIPSALFVIFLIAVVTAGYVYLRRGRGKDLGVSHGKQRSPSGERRGKQRSPTDKKKTD